MKTPRAGAAGGMTPARDRGVIKVDRAAIYKNKGPYVKKEYTPEELERIKFEQEMRSKYRDRAAERRKDVNPDYEPITDQIRSLTAAESQFLGGDMEHTHLVKGLDRGLLERTRAEMELKIMADKELKELDSQLDQLDEAADANEEAKLAAASNAIEQEEPPEVLNYSARLILKELAAIKLRPLYTDLFLPRRSAYVFELTPDSEDVPTKLIRSKVDCPPVVPRMQCTVPAGVMNRVARVLGFHDGMVPETQSQQQQQQSSDMEVDTAANQQAADDPFKKPGAFAQPVGSTFVPSAAAAATSVSSMFDDDDDIFPDAQKEYKIPTAAASVALPPVDDDDDDNIFPTKQTYVAPQPKRERSTELAVDEEALPSKLSRVEHSAEPTTDELVLQQSGKGTIMATTGLVMSDQEQKARGLTSVFRRDDNALRARNDLRDMDSFTGDSYEECYPKTFRMSQTVQDIGSDDEDAALQLGRQRRLMKPSDFRSLEEWEAYNARHQMAPRERMVERGRFAAHGGGRGGKEGGRGGHKTKVQQAKKEKRLDAQLKAVETIMDKRQRGDDKPDGDAKRHKQ
eukprot:TRINITY_DN9450_c0_g1_i1.p1 TRINITY_DN9450_c0_g1~~TRINITY_DN9450_c0_g1_i1.p1  ORF type:complete len:611 (+),score=181.15 TRINITY_DN9450_c0_g1_i1:122-1834(+)